MYTVVITINSQTPLLRILEKLHVIIGRALIKFLLSPSEPADKADSSATGSEDGVDSQKTAESVKPFTNPGQDVSSSTSTTAASGVSPKTSPQSAAEASSAKEDRLHTNENKSSSDGSSSNSRSLFVPLSRNSESDR